MRSWALRAHKAGRFYRADGHLIGDMADLPLQTSQLDRVYAYNPAIGRAWPHDIAVEATTRPVIVFTTRFGGPKGIDTYYYAKREHHGWALHPIVGAGHRQQWFISAGITIDHAHPLRVVLGRMIGAWIEIEPGAHPTTAPPGCPDPGDQRLRRLQLPANHPRRFDGPHRVVVLYVRGTAQGFRSFQTAVRLDSSPSTTAADALCTSTCGDAAMTTTRDSPSRQSSPLPDVRSLRETGIRRLPPPVREGLRIGEREGHGCRARRARLRPAPL